MISEDNDTLKSLAFSHIIHISHGFSRDYTKYRPEVTGKPGKLCHPMSEVEGDITFPGCPVTEGRYSGIVARKANLVNTDTPKVFSVISYFAPKSS